MTTNTNELKVLDKIAEKPYCCRCERHLSEAPFICFSEKYVVCLSCYEKDL